MNERIRQLWSQAGGHYNSGNQHTWPEYTIDDPEKFAELIVAEMLQTCEDHPGWSGRMISEQIKQDFGVEELKGWICPKCGADRTKTACPLGFGATVDGRCPMTVEAQ